MGIASSQTFDIIQRAERTIGIQRTGPEYREPSDHLYPIAQSAYFSGLQFIPCVTLEMSPVILTTGIGLFERPVKRAMLFLRRSPC